MKSRVANTKFVVGSSRGSRSAHTLLLQMAKEAEQLAQQAQRISELRDQKGRAEGRRIPQPEVADAVGVTLRAYQAWEAGDADPDPKHLKALAGYHGVTTDYIEFGVAVRERPIPPNLLASLSADQLQRIEDKLDRVLLRLGEDAAAVEGPPESALRHRLETDAPKPSEEPRRGHRPRKAPGRTDR